VDVAGIPRQLQGVVGRRLVGWEGGVHDDYPTTGTAHPDQLFRSDGRREQVVEGIGHHRARRRRRSCTFLPPDLQRPGGVRTSLAKWRVKWA